MNQRSLGRLNAKKWYKFAFLIVLGLSISIINGFNPLIGQETTQAQESPPHVFDGRALVAASDADMVATAYINGKLDRVAGINDTLTILPLPFDISSKPEFSTIPVSNSVMSWPQIIAVSPDGQRAYIAEVRGQPPANVQKYDSIEEMPEGKRITVVDISDPSKPSIVESVEVGRNPKHLSLSPDSKLLAVNLEESGREVLIIQLTPEGRLGRRAYFPIPDTSNPGPIHWHPSGRFLAINQNDDTQIAFYSVWNDTNGELRVSSYGVPLDVGNHLSRGRFTADGRFFLTSDLMWRTQANQALNFLFNPRGEMIAIRFDEKGGHKVVSRAKVGLSPEGFALSPDNSLIATVNMRRTYLSRGNPPLWKGRSRSSLSLVQFNPKFGQLKTVDEYRFKGILPEQATFDSDGDSLAVVIFHDRESAPREGAIEFWNVFGGREPRLVATGKRVPVTRGVHDIVLVP